MRKGFTLIELIVVVAALGILITIASLGLARYQEDARDSRRASSATVIAEALEKYYDKNGEYPSCSAMRAAPDAVAQTLGGISIDALRTPGAGSSITNSIICTDLEETTNDEFEYRGDGSTSCSTGASCLAFAIRYKEEATGDIKTIESRRQASLATSNQMVIAAAGDSTTSIRTTWNIVANATGYVLQASTAGTFASIVEEVSMDSTETEHITSDLQPSTQYFFRIRATGTFGNGTWSNTANAYTSPEAPGAPVMTASMVGTVARGTVSTAAVCTTGTPQYQFRSRNTNTATAGTYTAWSAWGAGTTHDVTSTAEGYQYGFQAQARCIVGSTPGAVTSPSSVVATVRPFTAPVAPTVTSSTTNLTTTFTRSNVLCPSGGTTGYQRRVTTEASPSSTFIASATATYAVSTANQGYNYVGQFQARCTNTYSTGPWSVTGSSPGYIRPVAAPTTPYTFGAYRESASVVRLQITSSCGSGAQLFGAVDLHTWDWRWLPGQHLGWRRASLGWVIPHQYLANTTNTGAQSSPSIPSGTRWNIGGEFRCQNSVTGRTSGGYIYQESGAYAL